MVQGFNEPRLSAEFYNPSNDIESENCIHISVGRAQTGSAKLIFATASDTGTVRVHEDLWSEPFMRLSTDDDITAICVYAHQTGSRSVVVHRQNLFRIWNCSNGSLEDEFETNVEVESVHATKTGLWCITRAPSVRFLDPGARGITSSLTGFSTTGELRHVFSDDEQPLLGVVDCFGQVFLYDVEHTQVPVFSEKLYGEAFAVCFSDHILAIVCPLKIILYRVNVRERTFVPMKSVMTEIPGETWISACILTPTRALGFSTHRALELISEEAVKFGLRKNICLENSKFLRLNSNRLLVVSPQSVCEAILINHSLIAYPLIRNSVTSHSLHHQTFCSDGSHLFLAEWDGFSLKVSPLSIPDCSFELELPAQGITAINGTVLNRRIVAGFSQGDVCGWMVGSSKVEFHLPNVADGICPIIRITNLKAGSTNWMACLDAGGTITVIDTKRIILKLRPNLLMPLLVRGYDYQLTAIDGQGSSSVKCEITHPHENTVYSEVWSLFSKKLVSSEVFEQSPETPPEPLLQIESRRSSFQLSDLFFSSSSRRESVALPEAEENKESEFEILKGIYVKKGWDFQNQIVSFNAGMNISSHSPTRELLDRLSLRGVTYMSRISGTWQTSFHKSSRVEKTLHAIFFPANNDGLDMGLLMRILEKSQLNASGKTILKLVQKQVAKAESVSLENPLEVLVGLCVRPHSLPGFRAAISEVESEETPWSRMTEFFVTTVENLLEKIHKRTAKWFEIDLFTESFPFVRKLIKNKTLFHEVFSLMFADVEVDRRTLESSEMATKYLIAIGARNPTKFAKRLALMVKTNHSADIPLYLIRRLVEDYRVHSLRFLSVLFEAVVLPSLDPMDYRVRKSSVGPVTDLFKTLNKFYPMTAFHQNRQKFALGTTQGQVIIFDVRSGTKWRILDGHTGAISAIGFDASGKYLCSYSATDCTARVWHITSGGVPGVTALVVHGNTSSGSVLGSLLGSSGGKCVKVKQLGPTDDYSNGESSIKHPFDLNYRMNGVKIRWTSETDVLVVRETGQGVQIRL